MRDRGRKTLQSLRKNIPVNDYQLLFPSRVSLYCVPVARANLETKDGWKARSDWPSGPWLLSLIGSRDRTHPVMAALSFPGTLCVRACTLQAASTTPCRRDSPTPRPLQFPSYLAHQPRRSQQPPSYLELYQNIITDCRVQVACVCICLYAENAHSHIHRGVRVVARGPFSPTTCFPLVYDANRQAW